MPKSSDITISGGDHNGNTLCYSDNVEKISKLQLTLNFKDELLIQKDNEIEALKKVIELLEGKN